MNKDSIDDISAIINEKINEIYATAVTKANLRLFGIVLKVLNLSASLTEMKKQELQRLLVL